jgi:hypothetical protein
MLIDAKAFFDYDQRENGQTLDVYDDFWYYNYNFCNNFILFYFILFKKKRNYLFFRDIYRIF